MTSSSRKSVRNMRLILRVTGILPFSDGPTRCSVFLSRILPYVSVVGLSVAIVSVTMYTLEHRSKINEYVIAVPYITSGICMMTILVFSIRMSRRIDHLLKSIDENVFAYDVSDSLIGVRYTWLFREENTMAVNLVVLGSEFFGFAAACYPLIEHFVMGKEKSLMYPGWMPWNPDNAFFKTFAVQLIITFHVFWLIFVMQRFILFAVIEFSRQNVRLCQVLSSIERRAYETVAPSPGYFVGNRLHDDQCSWRSRFDERFEVNLKQCIRHHQRLVGLFRIFESWFSVLFFSELLTDLLTFAIVFYSPFQTNAEIAYAPLLGGSYIFVTTLFTRCLAGEIFSDMSEKLARVIFYNIRWHDLNLRNRRLLSIFHSQVRRPMDLYAFSIFKASFFTFTWLMRTSYSYLNILKASFNTKN